MKKNKKILILRLNAIGDVVLSTIIPYSIKLKHPDCEIHYLTGKYNLETLCNCPYIDKVMAFDGNIETTIEKLRKQNYDAVVCLNNTIPTYKFVLRLFPAKLIFKSFRGKSWVENYFYTAKKLYKDLELPDRLYMSNENCLENFPDLDKINEYPKPHILINPGKYYNQSRVGRTWNIEKYKELSKKLLETYGGTIFVIGSVDEKDYHMQLSGEGVVVLSGMYSLKKTCALISLCDLVISGDSGPSHIASAFDRKTIAILGSTSPDKIKPYGKNGYYVGPASKCRYCWKRRCKYMEGNTGYTPCMESITVDTVMQKIKENNLL